MSDQTIYGGSASDVEYGGTGNDTIYGGASYDQLYGGTGNDTLFSDSGVDDLFGDAGNDILYGNAAGNEWMYGGAGDDTLFGAGGSGDDLYGGSGADVFVVQDGGGAPDIRDFSAADGDKIDVSGLTSDGITPITVGDITVSSNSGNAVLNFPDGTNVELKGVSSGLVDASFLEANLTLASAYIYGTDNDDGSISGTDSANLIYGGVDNDGIATGNDTILAEFGDDTVYGGDGNDSLDGGLGNDTVDGGAGSDTIAGGFGDDSINGGDGNDVVFGAASDGAGDSESMAGFTFNSANISSTGSGSGPSDTGDFAVYDSVGTTDDGTIVQARISVTSLSNSNLDVSLTNGRVELNNSSLAPAGSSAEIRIEFFDQSTGLPIKLDSSFTFRDVDSSSESVTIGKDDAQTVAVSSSPATNLAVTDNGDTFTIDVPGGESSGATDENHWATVSFLEQSSMEFTLTSRSGNTFYDFDTQVFSNPPTIISVPANDDDAIDAGAGDDLVYGGGGENSIGGGAGTDTLYGGSGNDTLDGNGQSDTVFAGLGNDIVNGGNGEDIVYGGIGSDSITDSGGSDSNDTIYGGAGADSIDAGAADDTLYGGDGADTLSGGDGADIIQTGMGADTAYGGAGNDTLGDHAGNQENDTLFGGAGDDTLSTSQGNDTLDGGIGNDTLIATLGNDILNGGTGNDSVDGGQDDDALYGAAGADTLDGGSGDDLVYAGSASDQVTGGSGEDTVYAGAGDDSIGGTNLITNGHFEFNSGAGSGTVPDGWTVSGPGGGVMNEASFYPSGRTAGGDGYALGGWSGATGGSIEQSVSTQVGVNYELQFASDIYAGTSNTLVVTAEGPSGTQTLATIVDTTNGGMTIHRATFTAADPDTTIKFTLISQSGGTDLDLDAVSLVPLGAAHTFSEGNDTIFAGAGNDTIHTGEGNDTLYGGDDQDTFILEDGFASDTLYGGEGGSDSDTLDLNALGSGVTVTYTGEEQATFTDGTETSTFYGIEDIVLSDQADDFNASSDTAGASVDGRGGDDTLTGGNASAANDLLIGNAGNDVISGQGGSDTLDGGTGNDWIDGGEQTDTIYGGSGNDTVNGGTGYDSDTVYAGDGQDLVVADRGDDVIYAGSGHDSYTGSSHVFGIDTIYGGAGNDDIAAHSGSNTAYGGADDDTIIGANGGQTFFGGDGNDVLYGGGEANSADVDHLFGGNGDDRIFSGPDTVTAAHHQTNGEIVYAGAGRDIIVGGVADDTIYGGEDKDRIVIEDSFGSDTIFGGEGGTDSDTLDLTALGVGVTVSYAGNEQGAFTDGTQTGTYFGIEDVILTDQADLASAVGLSNAVSVDAMGGNDTLFGSSSGDYFVGGAGDDTLDGNNGADLLYSGSGNDVIYGGGGSGTDTMYAGAGNDIVGSNSDEGISPDILYAGSGNDTLAGGAGDDTLYGGEGNDTILVDDGFGTDTIYGGEGGTDSDTLDLSALGAGITVTYTGDERGTFANGTDTGTFFGIENIILTEQDDDFDASNDTFGVDVAGAGGNDTLTGGIGDDTLATGLGEDIAYGGAGNDLLTDTGGTLGGTGNSNDTLYGGVGDDTLVSTSSGIDSNAADDRDVLYGGAGNDSVASGDMRDTVYGGTGDDTLGTGNWIQRVYGGAGNDTILGSADAGTADTDHLYGGTGNDLIYSGFTGSTNLQNGEHIDGGAGTDTLYGGSANDTLDGGNGADTLYGGGGNDTFVLQDGFGGDRIFGGETGTDFDTLDLSALGSDVSVSFSSAETGTISDGTHTANFYGIERFILTDYTDNMEAVGSTWSPLTIETGAGNDVLTAGDSHDTIYLGTGDDSVQGRWGDDVIYGGAGEDDIVGGINDDLLYGGADDDFILGSIDNDTVYGGAGDDYLIADEGNDTLFGGDGGDYLVIEDGTDTIYGDADNDWFAVQDSFGSGTLYGGETGNDQDLLDFWDMPVGVTVTATADEQGIATDGATTLSFLEFEAIDGSDLDDVINVANDSTGLLVGGWQGNDSIVGGLGDDSLDGGTQNDSIDGGAGDDTVYGGDGNDSLAGGTDNDLIYGGSGDDSLSTGTGNDTLFGGAGNDALSNSAGNDTLDGGTGNDTLTATLGDDVLYGGAGNDTLDGGADNDTLYGGVGNDTLSGGAGNDILTGGTGNDTFLLTSGGGDDVVTDFDTTDSGQTLTQGGTSYTLASDRLDTSLLDDGSGGSVTADEVVVSQPGGAGSPQILNFPSGETLAVPDGTIDLTSPQSQFASLVAMGVPPCFAPGTRIATPQGETPVELLRPGDLILTADCGAQPLLWCGLRQVTFGKDNPRGERDKPVLFANGALGCGLPRRDLVVSPQHRMLLSGEDVVERFGEGEVFAIAKALAGLRGVRVMWGKRSVVYHALLLARHHVIFAEGAPTESFRPGPVALAGFATEHRAEIFRHYPGLLSDPEVALGPPARPIVRRRDVEGLIRSRTQRLADRATATSSP